MSRRPPPALPPQPEDPVPVELDSNDGDGGAGMVDACLPSPLLSSMSPLSWSPLPWSPTALIPLWNFDDEQPPPQQMGPTANCSAAVLEAAPQDTSYGNPRCRIKLQKVFIGYDRKAIHLQLNTTLILKSKAVEKTFLLRDPVKIDLPGLETGGSSLAMIESYDDDDNDAEQCPRNSLLHWLRFTKAKQMAATIRDWVKTFLSHGLEKHMNTETGGSCFVMIASYDDANELGDNDDEQPEISSKRPRNPQFTKRRSTQDHLERNKNKAELIRDTSRKRLKGTSRTKSVIWPHFTKLPSADPGGVMAECNHCKTTLKADSQKIGTSSLRRHLENVHQMDLSSLSEAWKEPQGSSCPQKLQITGSAACAGSPTPLTENNGNEIELQEKDFELGDTSKKRRKGTSRTKSNIWHHFTKLPSADPGGVRAECNYCKTTLKAGSQNGTSTLWRHVKKVHEEKVCQEGS